MILAIGLEVTHEATQIATSNAAVAFNQVMPATHDWRLE